MSLEILDTVDKILKLGLLVGVGVGIYLLYPLISKSTELLKGYSELIKDPLTNFKKSTAFNITNAKKFDNELKAMQDKRAKTTENAVKNASEKFATRAINLSGASAMVNFFAFPFTKMLGRA